MNKNDIELLTRLLDKLTRIGGSEELTQIIEKDIDPLTDGPAPELKAALYRLGDRILQMDEDRRDALRNRRIAKLSNEERAELAAVEHILDENLLTYHFQPIISTQDGEIFAYEALMRSAGEVRISPMQILKYAEMNDRLNDVEIATFLNVLNIIENERERLKGRSVFINSIPNVKLEQEDDRQIAKLLRRNSQTAVVELTEIAEADEDQLSMLKEKYSSMNVRIAVDDFGTGYSNMQNLLRYTPNYVKIDRSLLSGIDVDSKKRHLVRDIIEFCHDNNIKALAEGVETGQELKTVILMGADLIQGYYTARPAEEMAESISYEIKQEIISYQQERLDGKKSRIYKVEGNERILLEKLIKNGYSCLRILPSEKEGNITVVGDPSLESEIDILIDRGFKGRLVIDNLRLTNSKNRPCIRIAEECKVELSVAGDCSLKQGGIYVPESSELEFTGEGSLTIQVSTTSFYCIGAPEDLRHGKLIFNADTEFHLSAHGDVGTYIGSGLGNEIDIRHGVFSLKGNVNHGVGIGSLRGSSKLTMSNCNLETDLTLAKGAVIGSRDGNADISLSGLSMKTAAGGMAVVCVGSVSGDAKVIFENASFVADAGADELTILGSLYAGSDILIRSMSMNITAGGNNAYVFGSLNGRTRLDLSSTDTQIKLTTDNAYFLCDKDSDIKMGGGRYRITINNRPINVEINA